MWFCQHYLLINGIKCAKAHIPQLHTFKSLFQLALIAYIRLFCLSFLCFFFISLQCQIFELVLMILLETVFMKEMTLNSSFLLRFFNNQAWKMCYLTNICCEAGRS